MDIPWDCFKGAGAHLGPADVNAALPALQPLAVQRQVGEGLRVAAVVQPHAVHEHPGHGVCEAPRVRNELLAGLRAAQPPSEIEAGPAG